MVLKTSKYNITIIIPVLLATPFVWFVLLYRRLRYGYPFRRIPLTQGKYAIVDPQDYPRLSKYKWYASRNKHTFYAVRNHWSKNYSSKLKVKMHREVLSLSKGEILENLSLSSTTQNPVLSPVEGSKLTTQNCHRNICDGFVIDHINHNGLDNRKANLRLATFAQNARNSRMRRNRSGYKGVCFTNDRGKYRAVIWHNNIRIHLGYFDSPISAAKAYDHAARKYHREFAVLNFDK